MFEDLFDLLSHPETGEFKINCSFMSLYNETLTDLLSSEPKATPIRIK